MIDKFNKIKILALCLFSVQEMYSQKRNAEVSTEQLQILAEKWKDAYNSKDAKNFIPLYAEDAEYISSHVDNYIASGIQAVIDNFQKGMSGGGYIFNIDVLSARYSCDMITVISRYEALSNGEKVDGRNLLVLKFISGEWKIVTHMTSVK